MGVYWGGEWLPEQIHSIQNQTHKNWFLYASDDGSDEHTAELLLHAKNKLREEFGVDRMRIARGPQRGFVHNFLKMVCDQTIVGDYFAFSDQDDIWDANKLEKAVAWLQKVDPAVPACYCGRTRLVSSIGAWQGYSPLFKKPPSFKNAIAQSIAGGNTMVFNGAARRLLQAAGCVDVVSHDWWVYISITACGGHVNYDPIPTLSYRQHDHNIVGQNTSWSARSRRIVMLLRGDFRGWTDQNIAALELLRPYLTFESARDFERFKRARTSVLPIRMVRYYRCGIYRQTLLGGFGLLVAALLNKL